MMEEQNVITKVAIN